MHENIKQSIYAPFLEELVRTVIDKKPTVIGVVFFDPEGNQYTNYFGDPCPSEKALMGYRFTADATFDEVMANAGMIVAAAQEEETEDD